MQGYSAKVKKCIQCILTAMTRWKRNLSNIFLTISIDFEQNTAYIRKYDSGNVQKDPTSDAQRRNGRQVQEAQTSSRRDENRIAKSISYHDLSQYRKPVERIVSREKFAQRKKLNGGFSFAHSFHRIFHSEIRPKFPALSDISSSLLILLAKLPIRENLCSITALVIRSKLIYTTFSISITTCILFFNKSNIDCNFF